MKIDILLAEARNRLRLSQQEVSEQIGVSQATYHNWESGKTNVSLRKVGNVATVLKIDVIKLIAASTND